ncbi:hypothetical protein BU17DRAFT_92326 [Hysterangium stoloniferum]|nr:hypothetical protein BU17DRAFT_92326 [Hysterangium stoloniferum]
MYQADDPDGELDLEDDLNLEGDMHNEDDVIDLKTPLGRPVGTNRPALPSHTQPVEKKQDGSVDVGLFGCLGTGTGMRIAGNANADSRYQWHIIVTAEAETAIVVFVRVELPSAYPSPFGEEGTFTLTWTRIWCEEGVGWAGIWIWIGLGHPSSESISASSSASGSAASLTLTWTLTWTSTSASPSLPHLNFTATTNETTSRYSSIPTQSQLGDTQHDPTANTDDASLSQGYEVVDNKFVHHEHDHYWL